MRDVAIFRQNLFRISEPFITQQASQLRRYQPFYLGRKRFGDAPPGAASLALQDTASRWALPQTGLHILTRSPEPYLRLLGSRRPALIHAHFGTDAVYALPVANRLGIPLVTTFHGFDATLSTAALLTSPVWANYVFFRRQLARHGDLFLCVSAYIRDRVLAAGFPQSRTHVHYTGIDYRTIQPRDPAEETPTILHVARLVEMKGTEYLLRAFATVSSRHPALGLVIIGDGALKRPLQTLATQLGLGSRIRFLGALPHAQVMEWIRKAMMLVLPSVFTATGRVEGLGMVLLEAAATGVPVIGSQVGGIPEGILDDETGFLVPERDPNTLARRITDLLESPDLRLRMHKAGPAFVADRFDSRRQGERLEAFYDAVCAPQHPDHPSA